MLKPLLAALLLAPLLPSAQTRKPFRVRCNAAFYNDRDLALLVGVYPVSSKYNDCTLSGTGTDSLYNPARRVRKGTLEVTGTLRYPHPLYASYYDRDKNLVNGSFVSFIDGGDAAVTVSDLARTKTLGNRLHSAADREYRRLRASYHGAVDTTTGMIADMAAKQQRMRTYISRHPDSYVALWDLVFDLSYSRSDADKRHILENTALFSETVKRSNTWKALRDDLEHALALQPGVSFPRLRVLPALDPAESTRRHRFLLVDFWYTRCRPCIAQFPELRGLYADFRKEGFEVLGVSVDKASDRDEADGMISKYGLDWPQHFDVDGTEAARLHINSFPANFLLDANGVILKKDLTPAELRQFLEQQGLRPAGGEPKEPRR